MTNLWRHAVASAHCAHEIGAMLAEPHAEVLFVAGLVHDIGKVLLLDLVANPLNDAKVSAGIETLKQSPELIEEFIEDYSSLIGLHIVQHWELPPEFAIATFCQGHIECVPDDSWLSLVHIVGLGSAIAEASGFGISGEPPSLLGHPATKFLGLNDLKLATLRVDLEEKIQPLVEVAE